ncbi:XdhC family protein [Cobetia amphilecti]|uniref:XdhC family protein n=1 Tax=Cobetia amphilecti TaxID=1055104 RepID=A0ABT6URK8_9GAMM|nr:XdhC family protein [Cobetia amphilecti]MDI5885339.1 XdhC family protein [Cobetia amphilecti]WOI25574.1 XdhC family protein [Cobetia amphilecti]
MQYLDLEVIHQAIDWLAPADGEPSAGPIWLCTVLATFGSSPREPGTWLVARADGQHRGSLSGGCVEEDFLARLADGEFTAPAQVIRYGEGGHQGAGIALPCGGILDVLVERFTACDADIAHLEALRAALEGQTPRLRQVMLEGDGARTLQHDSGLGERVEPLKGHAGEACGYQLRVGPVARLLLAGLSPVAEACAAFAVSLGFEVIICEPREEVLADWDARKAPLEGVSLRRELPSRFIAAGGCHAATAVVALTHDPRIDDLAMIEAVRQPAFYIGVMGSLRTSTARAERLARSGGLSAEEIARIVMPIGLNLGSKTPAEIALAVMADIVRIRRGRARESL